MNLVVMIGRLTKDLEVRWSQNSMAIASGNIAVDRRFKRDGDPDADFFQITAFGKTAEAMDKYLVKGSKIAITGHIQNDNYEKNGQKVYGNKIMIDSWEFAESKKESEPESKGDFTDTPTGLDDELPFQ